MVDEEEVTDEDLEGEEDLEDEDLEDEEDYEEVDEKEVFTKYCKINGRFYVAFIYVGFIENL